ncbi:MAG: ATP-binding protein [Bacillales bacterium]|jgi:AAA+ ATPase superfamily predicted ATPase|nr:ATP-binding protein [Bacillales bacterium]
MLIGRKREVKLLKTSFESNKSEFVIVYGRRRVGKTFLIKETFNDKMFFRFTGMKNDEGKSNNDILLRFMLDNFCDKLNVSNKTGINNWLNAFNLLKTKITNCKDKAKKVIFIDELPWMDIEGSMLVSAIDDFWNDFCNYRNDILLIICGSSASWITKKIFTNRTGLHNRHTLKLYIEPFTLKETEDFLIAKGLNYSRYQVVETYMVLGGIPYYLDLFDKNMSLSQNIDNLLFSNTALLKNEYTDLFSSLFKDSTLYVKVIELLVKCKIGMDKNRIAKELGVGNNGYLGDVLETLENCSFVRKYYIYPNKQRNAIYQIIDNYVIFYLNYLKNKPLFIEYYTKNYEKPQLNSWRGFAFERVCLLNIKSIIEYMRIGGIGYSVSAFNFQTSQIDLVLDRSDGIINLFEIKFSISPYMIDKEYHQKLLNKYSDFKENNKKKSKTIKLVFLTTFGLVNNEYSSIVSSSFDMNCLFYDVEIW